MRYWFACVTACFALAAWSQDKDTWVAVGADTEAKYYVDTKSIQVDGDTVRLHKRAVFNAPLADNFTGRQVLFKESIGVVELDCGRHINRVISIDMIGLNGDVVYSSGVMKGRMWEDVRENTHGQATFDYVCKNLDKS
jgi:hypothetical protein